METYPIGILYTPQYLDTAIAPGNHCVTIMQYAAYLVIQKGLETLVTGYK
jgi:hypothetical protein